MKTKYAFIIGLFTLIALSACSKNESHRGSGSINTEIREIQGFDEIELKTSAEVTIYQDTNFSIEVLDYQNIIRYTKTELVGNKLVIHLDDRIQLKNSKAHIIIHMPKLTKFALSGSGTVETIGRFDHIEEFEISGSGSIIAPDIHSISMISLRISGSGSIRAGGSCSILEASISGSGTGESFDLRADTVYANISGSGSLSVHAIDLIEANISGSGSIIYTGSPSIKSSITGSGGIHKK